MCWRFQIGSYRPFAKRNARMLSTDSLPRKWSMRNTCDSSKTSWTASFSARAEARSVPNVPADFLLRPLNRFHHGGRVIRFGRPEGQACRERRPGRVGGLGDAEVFARLLGVLPELLVAERVLGRRGADDPVFLRQQPEI